MPTSTTIRVASPLRTQASAWRPMAPTRAATQPTTTRAASVALPLTGPPSGERDRPASGGGAGPVPMDEFARSRRQGFPLRRYPFSVAAERPRPATPGPADPAMRLSPADPAMLLSPADPPILLSPATPSFLDGDNGPRPSASFHRRGRSLSAHPPHDGGPGVRFRAVSVHKCTSAEAGRLGCVRFWTVWVHNCTIAPEPDRQSALLDGMPPTPNS
jgi:hypothetical protein